MDNPFKFGTIVEAEYFTDRVNEVAYIRQFVESSNHLILISPRRFGKSSVVTKAVKLTGRKHITLNLQNVLSLSDMADIYPEAASVVRSASKDAWIICENYVHFLNNKAFSDPDSPAMRKLLAMPDDVFWQWSDRQLKPGMWTDDARMPEHLRRFRHIMRCHHGTQWDGGRHTLVIDKIREQCRLSQLSGMDSVSLFGECSPFHANTEFNYLALSYFGDDPQAPLSSFMEDIMKPRLGGSLQLAADYTAWAGLTADPAKIPAAVDSITALLPKLSRDHEAVRRWIWLASFLNAYHFEYTQQNRFERTDRIDLDAFK